MRLLVTRPEADGERLAERLRALGHEPILLPLIEVVFAQSPLLDLVGVQALIATSRNALRGLARNPAFEAAKRLPVFCVGEATAALATELGFSQVHSGSGGAKQLVPLVVRTAKPADGALLYITGQDIAFDMASVLAALAFDIRRAVLYKTRENTRAAPALAAEVSTGLDGAVLMSPRTAEVFAALLTAVGGADIRGLTCYCYSHAVAKQLADLKGLRLCVATRPTQADLLSLIGSGVTR